MTRATRIFAFIWLLTTVAYVVQPQEALPLFTPFPGWAKVEWAALNFAVVALVLWLAHRRAVVVAAFAVMLMSQAAWHSWVGALAVWVPWGLLASSLCGGLGSRERETAGVFSVLAVAAALALHRAHPHFLSGWEFGPEGTYAKAFPPSLAPALHGSRQWLAWIWLAGSALPPLLALAGRWRLALGAYLIAGLLSVVFYWVLFYGFFLLVGVVAFADPGWLCRWRWQERGGRAPWPLLAFCVGMTGFFGWFLFLKGSLPAWLFWAVATALPCLLAAPPAVRWPGRAGLQQAWQKPAFRFWAACFSSWLALPFVFPEFPAPFAATYFTAREARRPGQVELGIRGSCRELEEGYALRWGYRVEGSGETCHLLGFRPQSLSR